MEHNAYERISGTRTLVLCVHGIQGSPRQFDWLVKTIPGEVDYRCILLPGHGGPIEDFRRCGRKQWLTYVTEVCTQARAQYERVIYVGHSMGCLLGILSGISMDGMLLLACPLALRPTASYFYTNYRACLGKALEDPLVRGAWEANSVSAGNPLAYLTCLRPYGGLFWLMGKAKKALPMLKVPVTAVHSARDEIVSERSLDFFRDIPGIRLQIAPDSGHFRYTPQAQAQITEQLRKLYTKEETV